MGRRNLVIFGYILVFWGILPGILAVLASWGERTFAPSVPLPNLQPAATALTGLSGVLLAVAIVQYRRASGRLPISAFPPAALIRCGLFGVWRHPIYLFSLGTFAGLATIFRPAGGLLVVFPCLALGTFVYARIEERGLRRRFGGLYDGHRRQTSVLIPRLPHLVRPVFGALCRIFFRFQVVGRPNGLPDPPFVVIAAHRTYLDPVFISVALKVPVHFVTTFEMFRGPLSRLIFSKLLALPKKRYRPDVRNALDIRRRLLEGSVVGIFPEAERSWAGSMLRFKPETLKLFRLNPGIPILPVRLEGASAAWPRWARGPRREKVSAIIEEPVFADPGASPAELEARLVRLIEPRNSPAGHPAATSAAGIEALLYRCPECLGLDTVRTGRGPDIWCASCGARSTLLSDLSIQRSGDGLRMPLSSISNRTRLAGGPFAESPGSRAFTARARLSVERGDRWERGGERRLELTADRLGFGTEDEPAGVDLETIRSVVIEGARKLQVYGGRPLCLFQITLFDQSVLKWQDLIAAAVRRRRGVSPVTT